MIIKRKEPKEKITSLKFKVIKDYIIINKDLDLNK